MLHPAVPAQAKPMVNVEESKAQRIRRQQTRFRDRGGAFVPSTSIPLVDVLLARTVTGESPPKAHLYSKVVNGTGFPPSKLNAILECMRRESPTRKRRGSSNSAAQDLKSKPRKRKAKPGEPEAPWQTGQESKTKRASKGKQRSASSTSKSKPKPDPQRKANILDKYVEVLVSDDDRTLVEAHHKYNTTTNGNGTRNKREAESIVEPEDEENQRDKDDTPIFQKRAKLGVAGKTAGRGKGKPKDLRAMVEEEEGSEYDELLPTCGDEDDDDENLQPPHPRKQGCEIDSDPARHKARHVKIADKGKGKSKSKAKVANPDGDTEDEKDAKEVPHPRKKPASSSKNFSPDCGAIHEEENNHDNLTGVGKLSKSLMKGESKKTKGKGPLPAHNPSRALHAISSSGSEQALHSFAVVRMGIVWGGPGIGRHESRSIRMIWVDMVGLSSSVYSRTRVPQEASPKIDIEPGEYTGHHCRSIAHRKRTHHVDGDDNHDCDRDPSTARGGDLSPAPAMWMTITTVTMICMAGTESAEDECKRKDSIRRRRLYSPRYVLPDGRNITAKSERRRRGGPTMLRPAVPANPGVNVEESKAQRIQRQQARFRDRGGAFVPSTSNPLVDILLARTVTGESPSKAHLHSKVVVVKKKAKLGVGVVGDGSKTDTKTTHATAGRTAGGRKGQQKSLRAMVEEEEGSENGDTYVPVLAPSRPISKSTTKPNTKKRSQPTCGDEDDDGENRPVAPPSKKSKVARSMVAKPNDTVKVDSDPAPHKAKHMKTADKGKGKGKSKAKAANRDGATEDVKNAKEVPHPPSKAKKRKKPASTSKDFCAVLEEESDHDNCDDRPRKAVKVSDAGWVESSFTTILGY
ncbi:hypothetical protein BU15DRAFT_61965 [Melanogaster broomeanus]|nr:hypothetical protein BU15DRAFT_61965 [Melanogaster broomeanus]